MKLSLVTIALLLSAANAADVYKFYDRDKILNSKKSDLMKGNMDIAKRTLTPTTIDTPDTNAQTPDMNVLTPDTPDTPDTRFMTPETRDTPVVSGAGENGDSGDGSADASSGYDIVEEGKHKTILWLTSDSPSKIKHKPGEWHVYWKPRRNDNSSHIGVSGSNFKTETDPQREASKKENEDVIKEGRLTAKESSELAKLKTDAHLSNETASLLIDYSMLDNFLSLHKKFDIPFADKRAATFSKGYAKKSTQRTSKVEAGSKRSKSGQPSNSGHHHKSHSFKKQWAPGAGETFPGEGLGGEPIGSLGFGGLPGLAGEEDGVPGSMGGGEFPGYGPVGMPGGSVDANQFEDRPGLDEGVGGPINSFISGPMNGFMSGRMNGFMSGAMDGAGPVGMPGLRGLMGPQFTGNPEEKGEFGDSDQGYDDPPTAGFGGAPPGIESPHFRETGSPQGPGQEFQDLEGASDPDSQFGRIAPPSAESYMNLPADMSASMSNTLDAMDKANIQGDSEVGKIVRAAKGKSDMSFSHKAFDPAVISPSEVGVQNGPSINVPSNTRASFEEMQMDPTVADQEGGWGSEQRSMDMQGVAKRKLIRMRGKKDRKFKKLQQTSKKTIKA